MGETNQAGGLIKGSHRGESQLEKGGINLCVNPVRMCFWIHSSLFSWLEGSWLLLYVFPSLCISCQLASCWCGQWAALGEVEERVTRRWNEPVIILHSLDLRWHFWQLREFLCGSHLAKPTFCPWLSKAEIVATRRMFPWLVSSSFVCLISFSVTLTAKFLCVSPSVLNN